MVNIYALQDPTTGEVRYIGKTVHPIKNRLREHISEAKTGSCYKDRWISGLVKKGVKPEIFLLEQVSDDNWQFWERWNIQYYKGLGCRLTNITVGGDSGEGIKHTAETKWLIGEKNRGKTHVCSEDTRRLLSKVLTGRKGRQRCPSKGFLGKKFTDEQKAKIRTTVMKHYAANSPLVQYLTQCGSQHKKI